MPSTIDYRPGVYRVSAGAPGNIQIIRDANAAFSQGEFVELNSGEVDRLVAVGGNLLAVDDPLGMALRASTGAADTDVPVLIIDDNVEFLLPVTSTAGTQVTAAGDIGVAYELRHNAAGLYTVDYAATTNTKVRVVEIARDYPVGETYGLVWVKFIAAEREIPI